MAWQVPAEVRVEAAFVPSSTTCGLRVYSALVTQVVASQMSPKLMGVTKHLEASAGVSACYWRLPKMQMAMQVSVYVEIPEALGAGSRR